MPATLRCDALGCDACAATLRCDTPCCDAWLRRCAATPPAATPVLRRRAATLAGRAIPLRDGGAHLRVRQMGEGVCLSKSFTKRSLTIIHTESLRNPNGSLGPCLYDLETVDPF